VECVGKRSATPLFPLLSFAGTHGSPSAQCTRNDSCGKRRRRFALPAHSKSLHAFRSLGRQAKIDFRFATSGFGVTARDTLLEPDRRNLSQPNQTPISRAISARVTGMLFVFPWKRGESYRYLSLSTRLKPERWKYACGLKIKFSRY